MSTIKEPCSECIKEGDSKPKLIHYRKGLLCSFHNQIRLQNRQRSKHKKNPTLKPIKKMTDKRSRIERKINAAKKRFKQSLPNLNRCQSCGSTNDACGVSHIISVNDCLNDSRFPEFLAYDESNFIYECHTGRNCHSITESKKESSFSRKKEQLTFNKAMAIYKAYYPGFYELITNYLNKDQ